MGEVAVVRKFIVAMAILAAPAAVAAMPKSLEGRWINEDGRAVVEFAPCGAKMCGHIERFLIPEPKGGARDTKNPDKSRRDRKLLGSRVFWGLTPDGSSWEGHGYMPENGRNFKAHLTVEGSRMKLRGCVTIFCKTVYWKRAK
jgi:uncharacterized protein (DUF2147 family)